jgi:hypothetical protein
MSPEIESMPSRSGSDWWPVLEFRREIFFLLAMVLAAPLAEAGSLTGFFQRASPLGRSGIGLALSVPMFTEILSLEGEYSRAGEEDRSPSLRIWSGNVVIASPVTVVRLRPYFVLGLGMYRQTFAETQETSLATSQGFGVFVHLTGPAHLRLDYRAIQLQGKPLQENQKRFYGGLTLRF